MIFFFFWPVQWEAVAVVLGSVCAGQTPTLPISLEQTVLRTWSRVSSGSGNRSVGPSGCQRDSRCEKGEKSVFAQIVTACWLPPVPSKAICLHDLGPEFFLQVTLCRLSCNGFRWQFRAIFTHICITSFY